MSEKQQNLDKQYRTQSKGCYEQKIWTRLN